MHGVDGSHPHHPIPSQSLEAGAYPWIELPPPCSLQHRVWHRAPPWLSLSPGTRRLCQRPAPSKAVSARIRPPRSPMAPGRREALCFQPGFITYLFPSLALTHFFLSLFSNQLIGFLSRAQITLSQRQAQQHPLQTHFQGVAHHMRGTSENLAAKPLALHLYATLMPSNPFQHPRQGWGRPSTGHRPQCPALPPHCWAVAPISGAGEGEMVFKSFCKPKEARGLTQHSRQGWTQGLSASCITEQSAAAMQVLDGSREQSAVLSARSNTLQASLVHQISLCCGQP